jgi:hypoxanthine phosphoribosyltransferase
MELLFDEATISHRVEEMGREIHSVLGDEKAPLTVVGVMTGGIVFMSDLVRRIHLPMQLDLVRASSYRGARTKRGELILQSMISPELIEDQCVLLIDDIFDSGHTLTRLADEFRKLRAQRIYSAVLLEKPARCEVDYRPDFVGFEVPDQFVVGYGLDFDGQYRQLPYLAILEPEMAESRS